MMKYLGAVSDLADLNNKLADLRIEYADLSSLLTDKGKLRKEVSLYNTIGMVSGATKKNVVLTAEEARVVQDTVESVLAGRLQAINAAAEALWMDVKAAVLNVK